MIFQEENNKIYTVILSVNEKKEQIRTKSKTEKVMITVENFNFK
jgi:hypothetical protein